MTLLKHRATGPATAASTGDGIAPAAPVVRTLPLKSILLVGVLAVSDVVAVAGIPLALVAPTAALVLVGALVLIGLLLPTVPARLVRGLGPTGRGVVPRTSLAVVAVLPHAAPVLWGAAAALCIALQLEPVVRRLGRAAVPVAANLPGARFRNAPLFDRHRLFVVDLAALAVLLVAAALAGAWASVLALAVAGLAAALALVAIVDAALRIRARRRADPVLADALADAAPRFAIHWDATPGTAYQLTMWLPYLERLGLPFVVVLRNPGTFEEIAALTDRPLLVRRDPADLDVVVAESLTAAFYVNNAARNSHFVRFAGLQHVQLGHGESDKAPSYSPVHRMYTRTFVSGPAAVDRFAEHGVDLPAGSLEVVGRPQVAGMLVGRSTSRVRTALYAPTWAGANADSNYSSLPIGVPIVQALLDDGYRVLYRPHPYTSRDRGLQEQSERIDALLKADALAEGRTHLDSRMTAELDLHACFDAADLLVSDVSSVTADFLQSEKPYLLTAVATDAAALREESVVATSAYLVEADGSGLREGLTAVAVGDPMHAARLRVKAAVLGEHGGADPVQVFVGHARAVVEGAAR